jgi:hypothetical protein
VLIRRMFVLAIVGVLVGILMWSFAQREGSGSTAPVGAPPTSAGPGTTRLEADPPAPASSSGPSAGSAEGHGRGVAHGGSEILPSPSSGVSTAAGLPGLQPARSTTGALVASPLPKPASTTGALVAGYPRALAPPSGHTVATSSIAGAGDMVQASLTASCRRPCAVLRLYRTRLAARGFSDVAAPSVENQPIAALRRGSDSVTVTVTNERDGIVSYALFAVLAARPRA